MNTNIENKEINCLLRIEVPVSLSLDDGTVKSTDSKIQSIRESTLKVICSHMPIKTLFTPELKIDLTVFIKDQMLFHKIAKFLLPLLESSPLNTYEIAKHFEGSEILSEIKALFKQDPTPYLALFYEACADLINKKSISKNLNTAIEGRIFTLKNALIAQHSPELIQKSQTQCKISSHTTSDIVSEGANFIKESINLHLHTYKIKENPSFRKVLTSCAEQLIPFVKKVTALFLKDNEKTCPENPLTFRNPTGYNHHGFVAATLLEACLNALGYTTRLMHRIDLEPKVTLATAHNIVEVTGPDHTKYLIDPCYIQFHKDICIDESLLPKFPVLVLTETEVDKYIEENLMNRWKTCFKQVKSGDKLAINILRKQNQLISFIIDQMNLPKFFVPSNPENWVRDSFKRVWDLSTYNPIFSDQGFQEIFHGIGKNHGAYDYIKSMNIIPLAYHLPFVEVEKQLEKLLCDEKLKGQNSFEALSLISQLSFTQKNKYSALLNVDPRISFETGFGSTLNAYFRSLRKSVNPEGKDKSVIYACSGADCMSVLLATDAKDYTFVDATKVSYTEFKNALSLLQNRDSISEFEIEEFLKNSDNFMMTRRMYGGSLSSYNDEDGHNMKNLALKLLYDLKETGVDLNKVQLTSTEEGRGVRIEFPWQYYGAKFTRARSITFVTGDITNPETYPERLKSKLKENFDIFYMKSAFMVPRFYPQFLPQIAKCIKKDGWLMTSDKTMTMETITPDRCLEQNRIEFSKQKSQESLVLEELMQPPFDPLCSIGQLDRVTSEQRQSRSPGSDKTYWSTLSLRQKTN